MKLSMRYVLIASIVISLNSSLWARNLVLCGSATIPPKIGAQYAAFAGGKSSKILLIAWSENNSAETLKYFKKRLGNVPYGEINVAPSFEEMKNKESLDRTITQIKNATGIYFSGGDQNKLMSILQKYPTLLSLLNEKYQMGVVFGGSSAGLMAMAGHMLTGQGDFNTIGPKAIITVPGMNIISSTLLDAHFVQRQHISRIISALLREKQTSAIGIDAGAAALIKDERYITVYGGADSWVFIFDARQKLHHRFTFDLLNDGDQYDLSRFEVIQNEE